LRKGCAIGLNIIQEEAPYTGASFLMTHPLYYGRALNYEGVGWMDNDNKVVEAQLSGLARGAAFVRALAARDEREEIRGNDSLAEIFLSDDSGNSFNDPARREWLLKNYLPYGVYAYTIARTAYFDHIVEQGLRENVPQIVIIGAGYDSRPYRFADLIGETGIFELDDIHTQQRKRNLLQQANVPIPEKLAYAPLSYENPLLRENLAAAGFDEGKQTLFVWEGATYYLPAEEVDNVFRFIKTYMPAGSAVCFDYKSISSESSGSGGENELPETMSSAFAADSVEFGIEEGKTGTFLAERDFLIVELLTAEEMEKRYLTLRDGSSAGKVPARHCIAHASLSK
jgi:methyltransferase (TIGR00027 family)